MKPLARETSSGWPTPLGGRHTSSRAARHLASTLCEHSGPRHLPVAVFARFAGFLRYFGVVIRCPPRRRPGRVIVRDVVQNQVIVCDAAALLFSSWRNTGFQPLF